MKKNSKMTRFLHRWFAWLLVFPLAIASFTLSAFWTLNHNPATTDNGIALAGNPGLPNQLARSQARIAKLQIILQATQSEIQQINTDIVAYSGKAVATKKWAAAQPKTALPATNATTGASGAKK
jgi:hypothetical protein